MQGPSHPFFKEQRVASLLSMEEGVGVACRVLHAEGGGGGSLAPGLAMGRNLPMQRELPGPSERPCWPLHSGPEAAHLLGLPTCFYQ